MCTCVQASGFFVLCFSQKDLGNRTVWKLQRLMGAGGASGGWILLDAWNQLRERGSEPSQGWILLDAWNQLRELGSEPSQGCCRRGGEGRAASLEAGTPWNLGGGPTCDAFSQAVTAHWRLELSLQRPRGPPQGCNLGGDEGEDAETRWARVTGGTLPWRSRGGPASPSLVCMEAVLGRLGGQAAPTPSPSWRPCSQPPACSSLHHSPTTPRTARPPLRLRSSVQSFHPPTLTSPLSHASVITLWWPAPPLSEAVLSATRRGRCYSAPV